MVGILILKNMMKIWNSMDRGWLGRRGVHYIVGMNTREMG